MPRWSILTELINGIDLLALETALAEPAKLVLLESPSNPVLELIDIKAVVILAHKAGSLVMVDNVFASPLYQKPLALGADIVIYPITKHIDGQGRLLGVVRFWASAASLKMYFYHFIDKLGRQLASLTLG